MQKLSSVKVSLFFLTALLTVLISPAFSFAANKPVKKPAKKTYSVTQIFQTKVKKSKVMCAWVDAKGAFLAGKPDKTGTKFTSLDQEQKFLNAQLKAGLLTGKKKQKAEKRVAAIKSQKKTYNRACRTAGEQQPIEGPPAPAQYFQEHTDPLTHNDVVMMFQKLAYAPTAEDLAVCIGQTAAFCFDNRINVYDQEAHSALIAAAENYLDENETTGTFRGPGSNGSATQRGIQMAVGLILQESPNQYHVKLAMQFLQHHYAAEFSKLGNNVVNRRAGWAYIQKLFEYARTGDIKGSIRGMVMDPFLQIFLDNASNTKYAPGENYPREVLERYTIGQRDLDGNDRYDNLTDIPQFSKAFTGWIAQNFNDPDTGRPELSITFVLANFAEGPKYLWPGRPYGGQIETIYDALELALNHPGLPEYWAGEILERYLTTYPPRHLIENLSGTVSETNSLHAVIRRVAVSKEFFGEYRKSAMKEGLDMVHGFTRTLANYGFPVSPARLQAAQVAVTHEVVNSSQGPFGWPKARWSSQGLRMAMVNQLQTLMDDDVLMTERQFSYANLLSGLSAADKEDLDKVLTHIGSRFGVDFNFEERLLLKQYMEFLATGFNADGEPTGYTVSKWNPDDPVKMRTKIPGILKYIAASKGFGAK